MNDKLLLTECPRDAMQGWPNFIATNKKINYINELLKVGFDTIDCGSFVNPKLIPQMADTAIVIPNLNLSNSKSKLLTIVANERGATEAVVFDEITYLGFPFSISSTFQQKNTNSTIEESLIRVDIINNICIKNKKKIIVYISMGFGNPYGDLYNEDIAINWVNKLVTLGIKNISIADTVGIATPDQVYKTTKHLITHFTKINIGVHLHSTNNNWKQKIDAALHAGCLQFDGAIKGIGGCPMASNNLVGNMNTEKMVDYFNELKLKNDIDINNLNQCNKIASEIFI